MSHAAEGTLHAYLDVLERGPGSGALDAAAQGELEHHLAQCEVCAAALVEARSHRARAGAVLDRAAPVFDVPPFESMRAHDAPVRRARPARAWVPLAWAASLLMAVGAGWIASGLWREGSLDAPLGQARQAERTAATPSMAPAQDAAADQGASGAQAVEESAPDPQVAATEALPGGGAGEREVAAPPTVSVEGLSARVDRAAIPEQRLESEPLRVPPATGAERNLAAKARPSEAVAGAAAPAAPPPAPAAAAQESADRAAGDVAFPGVDVAWRPVSMTAAAALLGGPVDLVAGARVLSVEAADSARVRVLQQLPGGAQVELVQRPAIGSGAREQPGRTDALQVVREGQGADGRAWVVVVRGERELALRAPAGMVPLALVAQLERR